MEAPVKVHYSYIHMYIYYIYVYIIYMHNYITAIHFFILLLQAETVNSIKLMYFAQIGL